MEKGNKLDLSIAIIARNAETCIERCLRSVYRWAGEIIVVINDCRDNTELIARKYGAKVVEHAWSGFKEQKNFAKQLASMSWVLSLDADEEVSEELKNSIMDFIAKDGMRYSGGSFSRLTYFLGKSVRHGGLYPDINVRLCRRNKGYWDGESVHEFLHIDGEILKLKGDLLHYSYGSLQEQVERLLRYSELLVRDHKDEHVSPFSICIKTFGEFFKRYFLKLGFCDGFRGLYLALASSFFTLYENTRLIEQQLLSMEETPLPDNKLQE